MRLSKDIEKGLPRRHKGTEKHEAFSVYRRFLPVSLVNNCIFYTPKRFESRRQKGTVKHGAFSVYRRILPASVVHKFNFICLKGLNHGDHNDLNFNFSFLRASVAIFFTTSALQNAVSLVCLQAIFS